MVVNKLRRSEFRSEPSCNVPNSNKFLQCTLQHFEFFISGNSPSDESEERDKEPRTLTYPAYIASLLDSGAKRMAAGVRMDCSSQGRCPQSCHLCHMSPGPARPAEPVLLNITKATPIYELVNSNDTYQVSEDQIILASYESIQCWIWTLYWFFVVRLYRRPWWVFCGVLLKVMLLMTGVDVTLAPLAQMDSRPAPLFRNRCEQFIALIPLQFQSQNTDLNETLGHKWHVFNLYFCQAQAIAFIWAQQFFGYHRLESRGATNRSESCWLPHQSGEGDRADGSLQSWDR